MSEPVTSLPSDTAAGLERERWNHYAALLKEKKRLTRQEWDAFMDLTKHLTEHSATGDSDLWQIAKDLGAFARDQVPRCSKCEMIARAEQVAEWIEDGKSLAFMVSNAQKRWGVGYHALRRYKTAAMSIIEERAAQAARIHLGIALARIDHLFRLAVAKGDLKAMSASIGRLIDLCGLKAPVTQRIEISYHDSMARGGFECPEKVLSLARARVLTVPTSQKHAV